MSVTHQAFEANNCYAIVCTPTYRYY